MGRTTKRGLVCLWIGIAGCAGASTTEEGVPLRVGTTGDFPPFSISTPGGVVGVDVDLARDLGRDLGRPVEFVETTWPSMLLDAKARRFDVAMSGISITPPRQLEVDFSRPYTEHQRVAVVRCADAHRFLTFEDLDQPGITVVVNRGGAASDYARAQLRQATVRLVESSGGELPTVVAGTSDVAIVPPYSLRRHRGLCVGLQGRHFFSTPVGVLLPKGSGMVDAVNTWLRRRLEDGTVAALLDHYGTD